ncbi:M23 family metallopeptidase [Agromyces bauzanensis]
MTRAVVLALPFTERWLVQNSPARRVPSHGTDLFGVLYAIDFVGVDDRGRTAGRSDWRTAFATEPPERFFAFGRPILAPADGVVVATHDGEPDHEARRSQAALVPYMLGQASRVRQGGHVALAGNHVVIALRESPAFVALVHLQAGSLRVAPGDSVTIGQQIASCGNSGNSTQPHVHVQAMDGPDPSVAQGVPLAFREYREWPARTTQPRIVDSGIPGEGAIVEPLRATAS